MLALNQLWNAGLSAARLAELSARCGSDLPFFFYGPSGICRGRGEVVTPAPVPRAKHAVLVLPQVAMPTPAVYRRFDEMRLGNSADVGGDLDVKAWSTLSAVELLPKLVNDLEAPSFAIRPELGELRRSIESQLGRPVRMSGSGSSLFTLYDGQTDALAAARAVAAGHAVRALAVEVAPAIEDDLTTVR
jgi:4-diphosphocytidyl-2-C-methyl-D-erythritol kinase